MRNPLIKYNKCIFGLLRIAFPTKSQNPISFTFRGFLFRTILNNRFKISLFFTINSDAIFFIEVHFVLSLERPKKNIFINRMFSNC
ncbi:hypothetical protein ABID22_002627 [Pontibacter aydingkolensis]